MNSTNVIESSRNKGVPHQFVTISGRKVIVVDDTIANKLDDSIFYEQYITEDNCILLKPVKTDLEGSNFQTPSFTKIESERKYYEDTK